MKITISAQHLLGNDPEGFNASAWEAALESEYREIAEKFFPDAQIIVEIDSQNASGAARPVAVYFDNADDADTSALELQVEQAANALYDRCGQDFFE